MTIYTLSYPAHTKNILVYLKIISIPLGDVKKSSYFWSVKTQKLLITDQTIRCKRKKTKKL